MRLFVTTWTVARQAPLSISKVITLKSVATSSSRGSSEPGIEPVFFIGRWILYHWAPRGKSLSISLSFCRQWLKLNFLCMYINLTSTIWISGSPDKGQHRINPENSRSVMKKIRYYLVWHYSKWQGQRRESDCSCLYPYLQWDLCIYFYMI